MCRVISLPRGLVVSEGASHIVAQHDVSVNRAKALQLGKVRGRVATAINEATRLDMTVRAYRVRVERRGGRVPRSAFPLVRPVFCDLARARPCLTSCYAADSRQDEVEVRTASVGPDTEFTVRAELALGKALSEAQRTWPEAEEVLDAAWVSVERVCGYTRPPGYDSDDEKEGDEEKKEVSKFVSSCLWWWSGWRVLELLAAMACSTCGLTTTGTLDSLRWTVLWLSHACTVRDASLSPRSSPRHTLGEQLRC